jgi:hypothetical protein
VTRTEEFEQQRPLLFARAEKVARLLVANEARRGVPTGKRLP